MALFNRKVTTCNPTVQELLCDASDLLYSQEAIDQYNALVDVQNAVKLIKQAQKLTDQNCLHLHSGSMDQTLHLLDNGHVRLTEHRKGDK